jgi:hypothetical protein
MKNRSQKESTVLIWMKRLTILGATDTQIFGPGHRKTPMNVVFYVLSGSRWEVFMTCFCSHHPYSCYLDETCLDCLPDDVLCVSGFGRRGTGVLELNAISHVDAVPHYGWLSQLMDMLMVLWPDYMT